MLTPALSALSPETERPITVDFFKPDLSEFETIPWSWLQENELTLLATVRTIMSDAVISRRGDGGVYVVSQNASLAFEIPAFELPADAAQTLQSA